MSDPQKKREELVAEFLERRESGEELVAESFAADHPESRGLLEALKVAFEAESLFPDTEALVGRPRRIGPWRVLDELGRGGVGRVFRVAQEDGGPELALKLLNLPAVAGPRARERFRREGVALTHLEHPGIVRVREVSGDENLPYLVMDLVDGPSLSRTLADARREERTSRPDTPPTDILALPGEGDILVRAARLVAGVARATQFAHDQGLLHRDLKPGNVLLDPDGHPVLVDFGLAAQEGSKTLTATGDVLGTPNYMAPEQARGERADGRTDVWGLGAILYELLTLRPPHQGEDTLEVLDRIKKRPVPPVRRVNPSVPRDLERIVHRALAWRRAHRYATAGELADDLEAFVEGRTPAARGRGPLERVEDLTRFHPRALFGSAAAVALVSVFALGSRGGVSAEDRTAQAEHALDVAWVDLVRGDLEEPATALLELDPDSAFARASIEWAQGEDQVRTGSEPVDVFLEAAVARHDEQYDEALDLLGRVVTLDPTWPLPVAWMGLTAIEAEKNERAERELLAARRLLPESRVVAGKLSFLLRRSGRPELAVVELERLLSIHPDDVESWSELAAAYSMAHDYGPALEAIERAIELSARTTLRMANRKAAILDGLGRAEEAETIFRDLLADRPDNVTLLGNLGRTLDGECLLGEAREAYRRGIALDPDNVNLHVSLAHLAAGSGRPDCSACVQAFEANPALFDPEAAIEHITTALEVDRGEQPWLPDFAVGIAERAGRFDEIRGALSDLVDEGAEVDKRTVRIERALRKLEDLAKRGLESP